MTIFVLFGSMLFFLMSSIPIGIALGIATVFAIMYSGSVPILMIAQNAFAALDSFTLLAIPYFILAGSLMGYGGISRRLVTLAESLVGALIGGLAMVTVMACMFFAAISGSGPATVSAIGSFMIPAMREKQYGHGFASALIATAGTIGVIIPPSIPFVIYGVVAGVSIGEMFLAGIIPGVTIGIALMLYCYITAKRQNYPRAQTVIPLRKAFREAFWALLVPVIIMGGIYGGIFTPTEAAAVASIYALFIGKFIYHELDFKTTIEAFKEAMLLNGATSFMFGLSMSFAAFLTREQIPAIICAWMLSLSDSPEVIFLIVNLLLLMVGCFIDSVSSMIILTPMLLPIVVSMGMDPVHFGLVMTVALSIGFITPPYGANLFVTSAVAKIKLAELYRAILPFIVIMIACLLLFTYVPWTALGLVQILRG